jgi:cytoskeletal protein RodZ
LTGIHRRSGLGTGLVIGASIAIIVGAAVVGIGWWVLRDSTDASVARPTHPEATTQSPPIESEPEAITREAAAVPVDSTVESAANIEEQPPAETEAEPPQHDPQSRMPVAADQKQPIETTVAPPTTQSDENPQAVGAGGERVFEVEANLGNTTLTLDYIVARASDSYALINSYEVRVGSHIEGFTVEEITADWVRLTDENGPLVLKVPDDLFSDTDSE